MSTALNLLSSNAVTHTAGALTANQLLIGNGDNDATALGSLGSTTTVIHGNAAGAPTFGTVSLTADVSGILPTANGGTGNGFTKFSGPTTSEKTFTLPNTSDTIATLAVANVFTGNQTISNTAPSLVLTDTTASAKSLTIAVDANVADLRESAGASGSLLALDLANNRVGIRTSNPQRLFHLSGTSVLPYIEFDYTTQATKGYVYGKGTDLVLSGNMDDDGVFSNTAAAAARIIIDTISNDSSIQFHTGASNNVIPTERMRIDKNGQVGIGTTGPTYQLQLSTDSAAKPLTNTWTIASDERMKDRAKQRPYTKGLADILALPDPHYFTYNGVADTPEGEESVGWNAQDLLPIAPKLVRTVKGKLTPKREQVTNPDGSVTLQPVPEDVRAATPEVDTYGVNTHELQYMLVNAVRELGDRVAVLEKGKGK